MSRDHINSSRLHACGYMPSSRVNALRVRVEARAGHKRQLVVSCNSPQFQIFNLYRTIMAQPQPRRFAQIVHLKPLAVAAYKECHANVWPEILQKIKECNIVDCRFNAKNMYDHIGCSNWLTWHIFYRLNLLRQRSDSICDFQVRRNRYRS